MLPSCSMYTGRPSWLSLVVGILVGNGGRIYFIGFVVVLRIVFENLRLLLVIEVADEPVEVEFLAPFLAVDEPIFRLSIWFYRRPAVGTSSLKELRRTCGLAENVTAGHGQHYT